MIVVDASVVVELLLRGSAADAIADRLLVGGESWHAPHLLDVEVAQVLRRYVARRELEADDAAELIELLRQLPIARYGYGALLPRMWQLRPNLTAYDAAYVALAEGLRAVLITRDTRLASAPGIDVRVDLV